MKRLIDKIENIAHCLKIYPLPEETIIKRDMWVIFASSKDHLNGDTDALVSCEFSDEFFEALVHDHTVAQKLHADFCKALDDLGLDFNKCNMKSVLREGLVQQWIFFRNN